MRYSKKVLYCQFRRLQLFAACYRTLSFHPIDSCIYEVVKLSKDSSSNVVKYVDFLISGDKLPSVLPLEFDVSIRRLSSSDINYLVHQCKEYGIL